MSKKSCLRGGARALITRLTGDSTSIGSKPSRVVATTLRNFAGLRGLYDPVGYAHIFNNL